MCSKKKRGNIQKSSPATRTVLKKKNMSQTVKKRSTQPIKSAKNAKEQRLLRQKNELEKKKKQPEISTKRNLKQPKQLPKKNNLKSISTKEKTVRNSKKSTPEVTRAEIIDRIFASQATQATVTSSVPSSFVTQEANTAVSRIALQSNKLPLECSPRVDTTVFRGTLQSNKLPQVPGVRVIAPSTAVAPASVIRDELGVSKSSNPTGFNRNLEPFKILDMAEVHNNLYFLMQWKGSSIMDLVPVKIANQRCPQLVIQFYESRLKNVFQSSK